MSDGKAMSMPINMVESLLTGLIQLGLHKYYFFVGSDMNLTVFGLSASSEFLSVTVVNGINSWVPASGQQAWLTYGGPIASGLLFTLANSYILGSQQSKLSQFLGQVTSSLVAGQLASPIRKSLKM